MQAGVWEHYKGKRYLVLGVGHDADAEDLFERVGPGDYAPLQGGVEDLPGREVVVYVPLYDAPGPRLAVRTRERFEEEVCGQKACSAYGQRCTLASHNVPRFRYVGDR